MFDLSNIDWALLARQKTSIFNAIDTAIPSDKRLLSGVVSLLDNIQDHAVDQLGIPESEVFPHLESEDPND